MRVVAEGLVRFESARPVCGVQCVRCTSILQRAASVGGVPATQQQVCRTASIAVTHRTIEWLIDGREDKKRMN